MLVIAREAMKEAGLPLHEGPYCYYALPNYESCADIQTMYDLGACTVGASTVPEQLVCYFTGMRRVTFSTASSPSSGMSPDGINEEEVL